MELIKARVADIKPYERNPRKNDKATVEVAKSIEMCGYCAPIVVDENMVILAGHTRLKALKKLKREECDVLVVSGLSDEQKKKYRLYDNKVGELADWDVTKLEIELEGLDFSGMDINWNLPNDDWSEGRTDFNNTEYDPDQFADDKFKYECPECGFRFNG